MPIHDPRRERQEFLLGVVEAGTAEERSLALKELALIGDAEALAALDAQQRLDHELRFVFIDRALTQAQAQIVQREYPSGERSLNGAAREPEGFLPGNFSELRLPPPPPYDPSADRVTRDQARALEYLTRTDAVEARVTGLSALHYIGDETHLLAICRALMDPEPQVQQAARAAYKAIINRLVTGEPIRLPEPTKAPPPTTEAERRKQLRQQVVRVVLSDLKETPPIAVLQERASDSFIDMLKDATGRYSADPDTRERKRQRRQTELLRLLDTGNPATQWIALKELMQIGDPDAAARIFKFLHSNSPEVAEAAKLAYRQMKERELLGKAVTADEGSMPPEGVPEARLEQDYLAERVAPAVEPPAEPLPPEETIVSLYPASIPNEETVRLQRQEELLRLLRSDDPPTQWVALKELARTGDEDAAEAVLECLQSENEEIAAVARQVYEQMQQRLSLPATETPPQDEYLQARAPAVEMLPAVPPPPGAQIPLPPPPTMPPNAPQGHADPVLTAADFGEDDGRTEPLPLSDGRFAPTVDDPQEAALLPDEEDLGLLPQ